MKLKLKLKKGALHSDLGVPQGEKIPAAKLETATHSRDPKVKKRAVLAETMNGWQHQGNKQRTTVKPKKGTPVYMAE